MKIERPRDDLFVTHQTAQGPLTRHWQIELPRASVCSSIRAQIIAACGPAADRLAAELLMRDEDLERERGKLNARDEDAVSKALLLLRNAQAGRALRGMATLYAGPEAPAGTGSGSPSPRAHGPIETLKEHSKATGEEEYRRKPGPAMQAATTALFDAVAWSVIRHGLTLKSEALFGEIRDGAIQRAGLLYELAYASNLRLQWQSWPAAVVKDLNDLRDMGPGVDEWANALDGVLVSADELNLLFAWCVLHTFRPF